MGNLLKLKLFAVASILVMAALGMPAPAGTAPADHMTADGHHDMQSLNDCLAACSASQSQIPAAPAAVLLSEEKEEEQQAAPAPPDPYFYVLFAVLEQQDQLNPPDGTGLAAAVPPDLTKLYANFRI